MHERYHFDANAVTETGQTVVVVLAGDDNIDVANGAWLWP